MPQPIEYDKKEIFENILKPLVDQIDELCGIHQIPYFVTIAVENAADHTLYESRARTAAPMGITLTNDLLTNHVKVSAGFDVVLPDHIPDIEL